MAREFNPERGKNSDAKLRNDSITDARRQSRWSIMAAIALALGMGLIFWSMIDADNTTVSNTPPAVTTGSSATPSPSNPPAAPGPAGQGESNSTR